MSYVSSTGGLGSHGGFGYYGLGATLTIDWKQGNAEVRDLQQELQRLRFLEPGTGEFGADGKWGPRTESAIRSAARYVGWEGSAYTASYADAAHKTGAVEVPDDLIERLRAAAPAPAGTPGQIGPSEALSPTAPVEPGPEELPFERPSTERASGGWVPAAVIGGAVLLVGGGIWWSMRKPKRALATNRGRRRRRRRRR